MDVHPAVRISTPRAAPSCDSDTLATGASLVAGVDSSGGVMGFGASFSHVADWASNVEAAPPSSTVASAELCTHHSSTNMRQLHPDDTAEGQCPSVNVLTQQHTTDAVLGSADDDVVIGADAPESPQPPSSADSSSTSTSSTSSDDSDTSSSTSSDDDAVAVPRRSCTQPQVAATTNRMIRPPRPPSTELPKEFSRRAATAPDLLSSAKPAVHVDDTGGLSARRGNRLRRLGAALVAAAQESGENEGSDSSSDNSSTSEVSDESESPEKESSSREATTDDSPSATSGDTASSPSRTEADDDALYAKLVGVGPQENSIADPGPRERQLRTLLGNVWRHGFVVSRTKSTAARVHKDAVQRLIEQLVRERYQYCEAARIERENRRQALRSAEKAQRTVDELIARGLSRGASGTSALINNLPGCEPPEVRRRKKVKRGQRGKKATAPSVDNTGQPVSQGDPRSSAELNRVMPPTAAIKATKRTTESGERLLTRTPRPSKRSRGSSDATPLPSTFSPCDSCRPIVEKLREQIVLLQQTNAALSAAHKKTVPAEEPSFEMQGEKTIAARRRDTA